MSPRARAASFAAGLGAIAIALSPPVDGWSDRLLSVHMVQHLLLAMIAPPLLLLGGPVQFLLKRSPPRARRALARALTGRVVRLATRPAVGLAVFAAAMLLSHLTGLFELALRHDAVHAAEHGAYLLSGLLLFAPLLAPASGPIAKAPGGLARFLWLMAAMVPMTAVGALLSSENHVRYPSYLAPAKALGRSALADQRLAGAIMWVGGGLAMTALAIGVAMAAMLAEERRQQAREARA
jgi:cytochrome c oxidase assembly factor CtaG